MTLSLMQALNEDRLEDFIIQEEIRGESSVCEAKFYSTASTVFKTQPQDDQTSDSPQPDGMPER